MPLFSSKVHFSLSMTPKRYPRFSDISTSERILNSVFLLTVGIGYLVALANLYYTYQARDGRAGLGIEDIVISYYGASDQTRLASAVRGIMRPNLKFESDRDVILKWIEQGAQEPAFNREIAPILIRDCVKCHTPAVNPSLPDLTSYPGVLEVARPGGATMPFLIRVSHIHLFGIAFILYFIGRIFLLCDLQVTVKRIAVVIPFLAMILDVLSWFVTRSFPGFAYVVVVSGALMGVSMGLQILLSLWQMWFHLEGQNAGR